MDHHHHNKIDRMYGKHLTEFLDSKPYVGIVFLPHLKLKQVAHSMYRKSRGFLGS